MRRWRAGDGHDRGASQLTEAVRSAQISALIEEEPRLLLVYFWQPGCEPCRELLPQLEEVLAANTELCRAVSVDVDSEPAACSAYMIRRTPTVAFFKTGREVHRFHGGALPASVRRMVG